MSAGSSPLEAVAQAIHNAEYANEPWKKFETLHPDDADHYRFIAAGLVQRLGISPEHRPGTYPYQWRWVSSWTSGSDA